jgi:hypothetical protein
MIAAPGYGVVDRALAERKKRVYLAEASQVTASWRDRTRPNG